MDRQLVKAPETLHKSSLQYFCHVFWSLWNEICSKNFVLVISKTLRLFVNILTLDDKYSLSVKASVECNQFKCNYITTKKNFLNFSCISRIYIKLRILLRKIWASEVISYWNYRLEKAELLKWTKNSLSEHLWTVNMLKGPKHWLNMHGSIFFIIFDHSERKPAPKTLF